MSGEDQRTVKGITSHPASKVIPSIPSAVFMSMREVGSSENSK